MSTIQDSLTRQQFSMITSILYKVYESPAATLYQNRSPQLPAVRIQHCCSPSLCEFEDFAVTGGVIELICTDHLQMLIFFVKFAIFNEF